MGPSLYDTVKVEGTVKTGGWPRGAEIYVNQAGAACDPESDASSMPALISSAQNRSV